MATDFRGPTTRQPLILRPGDDAWGPFAFSFANSLPSGVLISSAAVESYHASGDSAALVEPDSESVTGDTEVQLLFQAGEDITAGNYYLRFELALSNGGTKFFRFGPVKVEGWS